MLYILVSKLSYILILLISYIRFQTVLIDSSEPASNYYYSSCHRYSFGLTILPQQLMAAMPQVGMLDCSSFSGLSRMVNAYLRKTQVLTGKLGAKLCR